MYVCLLGTILFSNCIPVSTPSIYFQPKWGQVQKKAHKCLNKNAWWRHLQPYPLHLFNLLILVDNETVPSLLYVVLCNCNTGFGNIQNMHPKTQWYLPIPVKVTHITNLHILFDISFVLTMTSADSSQGHTQHQRSWSKQNICQKICANLWCGLGWVEHIKYHPSYKMHAEKQVFLWPWPDMQLGQGQNEKYVQLISTKYIVCWNMWSGLEPSKQNTTHFRDRCRDTHTHHVTWILCRMFGAFALAGNKYRPRGLRYIFMAFHAWVLVCICETCVQIFVIWLPLGRKYASMWLYGNMWLLPVHNTW